MSWHRNSPVWHPTYQRRCLVRTNDGKVIEAQLIHLNPQYHQKVENLDVWRIRKHKYIKDSDVAEWRYMEEAEQECADRYE